MDGNRQELCVDPRRVHRVQFMSTFHCGHASRTGRSMNPAPWAEAMRNDQIVRSRNPTCIPPHRRWLLPTIRNTPKPINMTTTQSSLREVGGRHRRTRQRERRTYSQDVPYCYWQQRLPDRPAILLLQSQGDCKQPAHGWINSVVRPKKKERCPGP